MEALELQRGPKERARGPAIYSETALINPTHAASIKAPTLKEPSARERDNSSLCERARECVYDEDVKEMVPRI